MLPDWVSKPGPLTYESGALPIALRGPAPLLDVDMTSINDYMFEDMRTECSVSLCLITWCI